jgi:hypothetical protein
MNAGHVDLVQSAPSAVDELAAALGGAPLPEPIPPGGEDDKRARKRRKREARVRRDSERPPRSFERFRILNALIDEGRQVIELADHKARYALVLMGVLNAGVFVLMSRAHLIADVSPSVKPWLLGFLVAYTALSFGFMLHAIDCLRPRYLRYSQLLPGIAGQAVRNGRRGIMYWEAIADYDLEAYRHTWGEVSMEQINGEAVVIAHRMALLIRAKYTALGRLYAGLVVLVVLAAVLLALYTAFALAA